uniref:Peptidase S54 rhomboid domain-containing protein n=2 Tax=Rhodosorus marinus TaxID=101924 RepID=A0A7S3ELK7_9RHOD|mmetsp:Transcript_45719/g.178005  ORF Transcript_45719/g.178005 Transcript_45719/m.178005 type:complete len:267 (+) Transcript_45719:434-1234(+)
MGANSTELPVNELYSFSVYKSITNVRNFFRNSRETFKRRSKTTEGRTILTLLGMNSCIFLAWRISKKRPNASIFMVQHFTCSRDSMQIGRLHTLFTSNLSHYDPLHFTINMVVLYNVGNEVIQIINPSRFTQLYFFGGFSSSVTSVMLKRVRRSPRVSLGASGSVMAMLFMFAQLFPERKAIIVGKPISVQDMCLASVVVDIMGIIMGFSGIDFAAHLGGAAFGYSYFRLISSSLAHERREKREQSRSDGKDNGSDGSLLRLLKRT